MYLDAGTKQRVKDLKGKKIGQDVVLDHDLADIVEAFKAFAVEEKLDFFA